MTDGDVPRWAVPLLKAIATLEAQHESLKENLQDTDKKLDAAIKRRDEQEDKMLTRLSWVVYLVLGAIIVALLDWMLQGGLVIHDLFKRSPPSA